MDAVDQAVDQWVEMERKAAAWDALLARVEEADAAEARPEVKVLIAWIKSAVQTAQTPSAS